MTNKDSLIEIGSQVSVDINLIRDKTSSELIDLIKLNAVGTIIDYKLTDGGEIGFVLKFNDGSIVWFFRNEIISNDSSQSHVDPSFFVGRPTDQKYLNKTFTFPSKNNRIPAILNPFLFFDWLFYSLKDLF